MNKLQALFVKIADRVELDETPLVRYFYLFGAILSVRLMLEFFSSHRLFTLDDILHIGLWFTFIVLAFLLQLHLFSGEKIGRIIRLVVTFFSIALTAPIIDLVISGGVGAKMNYLSLSSWQDVAWSYITIGGSSLSRGATPGIRVEIGLLVLACFNYVRTKRNNVLWGIFGAWSVYTVLFLSGTVPLVLGGIVRLFNLQYQPDDQSTLLLLLMLDLLMVFLVFVRISPVRIKNLLWQAPWGRVGLGVMMFCAGAALAVKNYPGNWQLNPTTLFWFPLFFGLMVCFAVIPVLQQRRLQSFGAGNGALLLIALMSGFIGAKLMFTCLVIWGLLFLLNEKPLHLREVPVLRNLLESMVLCVSALAGFAAFGAPVVGFPATWLLSILSGMFIAGAGWEWGKMQLMKPKK